MRRKEYKDGKKHCGSCGSWRSPEDFHRNRRHWDGLHGYCRDCMSARAADNYQRNREAKLLVCRRYRTENKAKRKAAQVLARYGISADQYRHLVEQHSGACAICGGTSKRALHVDHNHATGEVRGLLCVRCNTAIGAFRDSPQLLQSAIDYLNRSHKC